MAFIKEIYPGASGSPVDMAKMMALPEIEPDDLIAGIELLPKSQITFLNN